MLLEVFNVHPSAQMTSTRLQMPGLFNLSCDGLFYHAMQVADARRQKSSMLDRVIKAFNEEPAVQITGEVRSRASIWDEGGLAPLPKLQSAAV